MNPYEVLGVAREATPAQIRGAYRKLAKKAHPDVGGDAEAFARLNACYELLMDPARRARYDRTGDFEEEKPDNTHVEPLALICQALMQMITETDRPHEVDLAAALRRYMEARRGKLEESRAQGLREREKTHALAGRFSVAKGKENFLEAMIAGRLAAVELGLKKVEHEDEVTRAAMELLKGAKFRFDRRAPAVVEFVWMSGN